MPDENGSKAEGPTGMEKKIIKQIEYYFGDMNLGRDKFLQGLIKEEDGWVTFETMLKFNRLRTLCEDLEAITAAMRKSDSGLMEVSEDGTKLRRLPSKPLPEYTRERKADLKNRSVYAKGFPLDVNLDQLLEFFEQFGSTEQIQMRKNEKKEFKGSCFVVYHTEEAAKKFVSDKEVKFQDKELESRQLKDDYFKRKIEERKTKRTGENREKEDAKHKMAEEEETQRTEERMTKGAILSLSGLAPDTSREDLKKVFQGLDLNVAWVDLTIGDTQGRLRFPEEGLAQKAVDKCTEANGGKFMIKDREVQAKVLEGEEELDHWKKIFESQKEQRNRKRKVRDSRPRGGKRGSYKGFNKKGKKSRSRDDDEDDGSASSGGESDGEDGEPSAKQAKAE